MNPESSDAEDLLAEAYPHAPFDVDVLDAADEGPHDSRCAIHLLRSPVWSRCRGVKGFKE